MAVTVSSKRSAYRELGPELSVMFLVVGSVTLAVTPWTKDLDERVKASTLVSEVDDRCGCGRRGFRHFNSFGWSWPCPCNVETALPWILTPVHCALCTTSSSVALPLAVVVTDHNGWQGKDYDESSWCVTWLLLEMNEWMIFGRDDEKWSLVLLFVSLCTTHVSLVDLVCNYFWSSCLQ